MKMFVLFLVVVSSVNAFAADTALKCVAEYRAVMTAQRTHIKATDRLGDYAVYTGEFMQGMAVELIAQPNARVGGYGYSVRSNATTIQTSFTNLIDGVKAKEELVHQAMLGLEDCLYGVTPAETETPNTQAE